MLCQLLQAWPLTCLRHVRRTPGRHAVDRRAPCAPDVLLQPRPSSFRTSAPCLPPHRRKQPVSAGLRQVARLVHSCTTFKQRSTLCPASTPVPPPSTVPGPAEWFLAPCSFPPCLCAGPALHARPTRLREQCCAVHAGLTCLSLPVLLLQLVGAPPSFIHFPPLSKALLPSAPSSTFPQAGGQLWQDHHNWRWLNRHAVMPVWPANDRVCCLEVQPHRGPDGRQDSVRALRMLCVPCCAACTALSRAAHAA